MPIPAKTMPISLVSATPTALTAEALCKQLESIGLTCPDSKEEALKKYIAEVKDQLPIGDTQTFAILNRLLREINCSPILARI